MSVDDESEFDREDEHEHREDCGHSEHDHKRIDRVHKNFEKFLAENAGDLLNPEQLQKIQKKVDKLLKSNSLTSTLTSLKAFQVGYQFGVMTQTQLGPQSAQVYAGLTKLVSDREAKVKKVVDEQK